MPLVMVRDLFFRLIQEFNDFQILLWWPLVGSYNFKNFWFWFVSVLRFQNFLVRRGVLAPNGSGTFIPGWQFEFRTERSIWSYQEMFVTPQPGLLNLTKSVSSSLLFRFHVMNFCKKMLLDASWCSYYVLFTNINNLKKTTHVETMKMWVKCNHFTRCLFKMDRHVKRRRPKKEQ